MPSKVPQPPPEGGPPKYVSPPPPPKKCSHCGGSGAVTISFDPPAYERCECSFTEAEWKVIALNDELSRYKAALAKCVEAMEIYSQQDNWHITADDTGNPCWDFDFPSGLNGKPWESAAAALTEAKELLRD